MLARWVLLINMPLRMDAGGDDMNDSRITNGGDEPGSGGRENADHSGVRYCFLRRLKRMKMLPMAAIGMSMVEYSGTRVW